MFAITCSAGTVVDLGVHWILTSTVFGDSYWFNYWIAPFISFELGTVTNFIIAYYFVWRDRISQRTARSFWRHFAGFNAIGFGSYLVKFVVMQGFHFLFLSIDWIQGTSYEPVICNAIGMAFSGIFSFFMNEFVVFGKRTKK